MADYTYGYYVYFKNMTDIPNEHHNHLILNQIPDIYITLPLKFMDEIFESFPGLFVDRMHQINFNAHIQIVAQLSKFNVWRKYNSQMEQVYNARE